MPTVLQTSVISGALIEDPGFEDDEVPEAEYSAPTGTMVRLTGVIGGGVKACSQGVVPSGAAMASMPSSAPTPPPLVPSLFVLPMIAIRSCGSSAIALG